MRIQNTQRLSTSQYASANKLQARWDLYDHAIPKIDIHRVGIERLGLSGNESVLEVGCGDGAILTGLRRGGHAGRLVGVEITDGMFADSVDAIAREPGLSSIEFLVGSADRLPYPDKAFDVILSFFMLYHMPDIQKTLREWRRVLKDDGRLLIATGSKMNKPKQKAFKMMAEDLIGKKAPPQFSSSFNLENAKDQLRGTFRIVDEFVYRGEIRLETADPYLRAFRSIRDMYEPLPSDAEWETVELAVRAEIEREIAENGFFIDHAERGFFLCEK